MKLATFFILAACVTGAGAASAKTLTVAVNKIDDKGVGEAAGRIKFADTKRGMQIRFNLKGLPPGQHGFHVHMNPDCGPADNNGKPAAGFAAGGHFDPENTGKHRGPMSMEGHKGDMPFLTANAKGRAFGVGYAPHFKVADLAGHSVMIHAGGDNYADEPAPLGGGGARIACGVVK